MKYLLALLFISTSAFSTVSVVPQDPFVGKCYAKAPATVIKIYSKQGEVYTFGLISLISHIYLENVTDLKHLQETTKDMDEARCPNEAFEELRALAHKQKDSK